MRARSLLTKFKHVHSGLHRSVVATLMLVSTAGCSLGAQHAPADSSIVVLSQPTDAVALGSMRLIVKDSAAYERVWALAWSRYLTPPKAPPVDFSRYHVVVIAVGPQSITGGRLVLTNFVDDAVGRTYHVAITIPGYGCIGGTAMTYNALFARVPKGSGVPLFRDTLSAPRCE